MKKLSKPLSIFLALFMLLSVFSAPPFAVQAAQSSDAVGATDGAHALLEAIMEEAEDE